VRAGARIHRLAPSIPTLPDPLQLAAATLARVAYTLSLDVPSRVEFAPSLLSGGALINAIHQAVLSMSF